MNFLSSNIIILVLTLYFSDRINRMSGYTSNPPYRKVTFVNEI